MPIKELPTINAFRCEIETPQHKDGRVHKMFKQTGWIYQGHRKFVADKGLIDSMKGNHDVKFADGKEGIEQIKKAIIKIL